MSDDAKNNSTSTPSDRGHGARGRGRGRGYGTGAKGLPRGRKRSRAEDQTRESQQKKQKKTKGEAEAWCFDHHCAGHSEATYSKGGRDMFQKSTTNPFSSKGKMRFHWEASPFMRSLEAGKQSPPERIVTVRDLMDNLAFIAIWFNEYMDRVAVRDQMCVEILDTVRDHAGERCATEVRNIVAATAIKMQDFMWAIRFALVNQGFSSIVINSLKEYVERDVELSRRHAEVKGNLEGVSLLLSLEPANVPQVRMEDARTMVEHIEQAVSSFQHALVIASNSMSDVLDRHRQVANHKLLSACLEAILEMQVQFVGKQEGLHAMHQFAWPDDGAILEKLVKEEQATEEDEAASQSQPRSGMDEAERRSEELRVTDGEKADVEEEEGARRAPTWGEWLGRRQ